MLTRNYEHFDLSLNRLIGDVYEQPVDDGHTKMTNEILDKWVNQLLGCKNVVDMGCGQIAPQERFESYGISYTGVALGVDVSIAQADGKNVVAKDMTFTDFEDESFDLVYSRHSLEHSPFPLLTLMEWHRVAAKWLLIILPSPESYTYTGKNHYGVMNHDQAMFFLQRAGWEIIWDDTSNVSEIRLMCQKVKIK